MRQAIITGLFCLIWTCSSAQLSPVSLLKAKDSTESKTWSLKGYPIAFYLPETRFGFGASGAFTFKTNPKDTTLNDSQILIGAAYTLNKQVLLYLPFKVFWGENKNYTYGEVGYYRYFFNYYGIGNHADPVVQDTFKVNFPRIRAHYTYRVYQKLGVGGAAWFEDFQIGETTADLVENAPGGEGGITSGIGPMFIYDSRDHVFYPSKGWYIEGKVMTFQDYLGSAYNFTKGGLDVVNYTRLHKKGILATHLNYQFSNGNVPFNMMSMLGGTKRMRGYIEGRYRDKNALILQTEYRFSSIWRFGFVLFGDIGQTYERTDYLKLNDWHWTAGGGLRFMLDTERKINIRLDYGVGKNTSGFYFTIGEAF